MDNRAEFSHRLKDLRKELGYTPKEFAALLDIKQQTYYAYEKGKVPSFDVLINIAEKCNVSLDWLCGMTKSQNYTAEKKDITDVLEQLLEANKDGKPIEVQIVCQNNCSSL